MADPAVVKGPGMLWVMSSISRPDIMDEKTYMKWYDEDHIAEIMETSGIQTAYRYKDVDIGKVDKPYLAFYPMKDLAFTTGEDFKKIRVKSDLLPGSRLCYDLADIDVRYVGLVGKTEYAVPKKESAPYVLLAGIYPSDDTPESEVEKYYDEQIKELSKAKGYMRSTRFKLLYARSNAQSRALKGLPTTDTPPPEPPTRMVLHEFSEEPDSGIRDKLRTDKSNKIVADAKETEAILYKLVVAHGRKNFFE
ncbi:hypothetical protein BU16DRAFT_622403 [Lophium mytilinum]|uniref:Uncharacterized protein n=1 Tax=Lophium mytilinum TaxID=390894 RepID=A0A6A6QDR3_9PEZI|nr:hypothetical protein BU16DRAFT_622403 [Lophium mytilinum]